MLTETVDGSQIRNTHLILKESKPQEPHMVRVRSLCYLSPCVVMFLVCVREKQLYVSVISLDVLHEG